MKFIKFSGLVCDSDYSFGEVEALSYEFIEFVGRKRLGDGYFFALAHEF